MDLDGAGPKLLGCVAILLEEDDTRESDMVFGRIAYSKEMEKQLNDLMRKRIQTNNNDPLTEDEKNTIKAAVTAKVEDAVGSHQSAWDWFRDQDDSLGFTYKIVPEHDGDTIHAQTFEFPEITTTKQVKVFDTAPPLTVVTDRYVLSGEITIGAVPGGTVDLCAGPRAAVQARNKRYLTPTPDLLAATTTPARNPPAEVRDRPGDRRHQRPHRPSPSSPPQPQGRPRRLHRPLPQPPPPNRRSHRQPNRITHKDHSP